MKLALLVPLVLTAALTFLLFRPGHVAPPYRRPPLLTPVVLDDIGFPPPGVQLAEPGPAGEGLSAWH